MGVELNICEIFDIAKELEKNRAAFFLSEAKKFSDKKISDTLLEFAENEQRYANKFAHIKEGFSQAECPLTVPDPDNEDFLYLKAMTQDHICPPGSCRVLNGSESLQEVFQMAIGMEKEAVVFYTGLKNFVPETSKKNVDFIIKEKMTRIAALNKKLNGLKS